MLIEYINYRSYQIFGEQNKLFAFVGFVIMVNPKYRNISNFSVLTLHICLSVAVEIFVIFFLSPNVYNGKHSSVMSSGNRLRLHYHIPIQSIHKIDGRVKKFRIADFSFWGGFISTKMLVVLRKVGWRWKAIYAMSVEYFYHFDFFLYFQFCAY